MVASKSRLAGEIAAPESRPDTDGVVLFDGYCVLCSGLVGFLFRADRKEVLRFVSIQSEEGGALCRAHGVDADDPSTFLFVANGQALRESDAALAIARTLPWPWKALSVFRFVPRGLRDPVYRFVARHRYRLFGRKTVCTVPPQAVRDRLTDNL